MSILTPTSGPRERPKLIYIKTPAPEPGAAASKPIARIQGDDRASYRPFSDPDELRSLVADDLAALLTERFSASAAPRAEPLPPLPRPPTRGVVLQLQGRLADARMLIVLDNMEQLTDAAGDVSDLLAGVDRLQLLVTSRRMLNIHGEHVFTLEPLAVPGPDGTITSAVELFLERTRAVRPEFQPSDEDRRRSPSSPGASRGYRWRSSWRVPASACCRSPGAVLERLGHRRLEFLRTGASDLPARQRTLRDTIAWSHSLLPSDSQLFFARLAVFVGSADLGAIEQVTNPDGRLDTLDSTRPWLPPRSRFLAALGGGCDRKGTHGSGQHPDHHLDHKDCVDQAPARSGGVYPEHEEELVEHEREPVEGAHST